MVGFKEWEVFFVKEQKILIDTDIGNDDIMAICILFLAPMVEVAGITTVNGVARADVGRKNLLRILQYIRKPIPVILGSKSPLPKKDIQFPKRDRTRAENLTLLSSIRLPTASADLEKSPKVEEFIFNLVNKEKVTIIALGPLTNIARTIIQYQNAFTKKIDKIILMGGGIAKGNIPPLNVAEYNIALDPNAANIVFNSNIPITMVGIDATRYVPTTRYFKNKVIRIKPTDRIVKVIQNIIVKNDKDFDYFYDPLVSGIFMNPSIIIQKKNYSLKVVPNGIERGKTIISTRRNKNIDVVLKVNPQKFYSTLLSLLSSPHHK